MRAARPSALLRDYALGLFIPTRFGPRFLESPGQRGSPRRCQCSEHLTVRSRAGRVDAQTACKQKVTPPPAGTAPAPSVRVTGDVPHEEQDGYIPSPGWE